MVRMNRYTILADRGLIVEYYEGLLNKPLLIEYKKHQSNDPEYSPNHNLLVDLRSVNFDFTIDEVEDYANFLAANQQIAGKRKLALITETPKQTVLTTLYQLEHYKLSQSTQIFSTAKHAIGWLNIDNFTLEDFEIIIEELKRNKYSSKKVKTKSNKK